MSQTDPRAVARDGEVEKLLTDLIQLVSTDGGYFTDTVKAKTIALNALADAERREAERCAKDVCMYCDGRALGYLPVSGPNQAGNHVHENSKVTGDHVLCRASGIYSRLKAQADKEGCDGAL